MRVIRKENVMKKFISVILCVVLACSLAMPACANDPLGSISAGEMINVERVSAITQNVADFVAGHGDDLSISQSPSVMYNLNDEIETLYFPLSPVGYVIISYGDGHVVEYSSSVTRNISELAGKLYYVGPLEYYVETVDGLTHLVTQKKIQKTDFVSTYHVLRDEINNVYTEYLNTESVQTAVNAPVHYVAATTANGYYCTITAVANLLQWYVDNEGVDMYAFDISDVDGLRYGLDYYGYVHNGGLDLDDVKGNHWGDGTLHHGLQSYFNRSDVDSYEVVSTDTLVAQVKNQIQIYRRPVLLTIDTALLNPSSDSKHAVMAYAYENIGATTYYYLNDGWGNNNVEVCSDDIPSSYPMLYIR